MRMHLFLTTFLAQLQLAHNSVCCPVQMKHSYHIRVLVPCYKESLDILRRTIMAAYDAELPEGCQRTIYLCDDGKDPKKRKWVDSLGPEVVYVSGRKRPPGELHRLCVLSTAMF